MRAVKVELVGLFPELLRLCPRGCDWMARAGIPAREEQAGEYPGASSAAAAILAEVAARLREDFQGRALPVSVGYLSLRGLWLAARHRLAPDRVYAVVNGRCLMLGDAAAYEQLRHLVRRELGGEDAA